MPKSAAPSKYYTVPVVECTFDIIELLRGQSVPMKMVSIAETTGIALSTTYRIVRTLVDRGYLIRDESGHYMASRIRRRPKLTELPARQVRRGAART